MQCHANAGCTQNSTNEHLTELTKEPEMPHCNVHQVVAAAVVLLAVGAAAEPISCSEGGSPEMRAAHLVAGLLRRYGDAGRFVHPDPEARSNFRVNMSFQILHFYGLDEHEILEIGVWAAFLWRDPRLAWNCSGLTVLKLPADRIWLPDVGLSNTKKENQFDFRLMNTLEALVYPGGSVYTYYHLVTNVACPVDVTFFPFDTQLCDFQFGPWTSYRGGYGIHLPTDKIRMANISKFVSEWDLVGFGIQARQYFDDNVQQIWDYFEVQVELRRKPYYYLFVIVLPFFMLSVTACLVFLADEPGDRVNMSIAILLTMTLYIMISSSSSPKSMQTIPLLGIYIMLQMAVLIVFTFCAIRGHLRRGGRAAVSAARHQQDVFLMCVYIGLTVANVCVCMIITPLTRRMM